MPSQVTSTTSLCLAAMGMLFTAAPHVFAQSSVSIEARAGLEFPAGTAARITTAGYTVGVSIAYRANERWQLWAGVDVVRLSGAEDVEGGIPADINTAYVLVGAGVNALNSSRVWELWIDVGMGVGFVGSEPLPPPGKSQLDETVFASSGSLELRYRFSDSFSADLRAGIHVAFMGGSLSDLQGLDPTIGDEGPLVSIPLQAGIRFSF